MTPEEIDELLLAGINPVQTWKVAEAEPADLLSDVRRLASWWSALPRPQVDRYVISAAAHARAVELIGPQPAGESAHSWLWRAAEAESGARGG